MKRVLFLILVIAMISFSCKKDDAEEAPNPLPAADYMQLKIGNYWVYQWYHIDSAGNANPASTDSSIIVGDTTIKGKLYFKKQSIYKSSNMGYIRDSSGYLVDHEGGIFFSSHDFTNILHSDTVIPGVLYVEYKMADKDSLIDIPLGTYSTYNFKGKVIPIDPQYPYGIQFTHNFYADGYGLIKTSSYYASNPNLRVERRLFKFGNTEPIP